MTNFLDVYTEVNCRETKYPILFPGDLLPPGSERYGADFYIFGDIDKLDDEDKEFIKDKDVVSIQSFEAKGKTEEELIEDINGNAWKVLLAAGTDRNLMVFDSQAENDECTPRLFSLINQVMRRNAGGNSASLCRVTTTDIFMRKSKALKSPYFNIIIHGVEDEVWDKIEEYHRKDLKNSLAENDSNLVLALCLSQSGVFVFPVFSDPVFDNYLEVYRQHVGIGSLDNTRVLLGSF